MQSAMLQGASPSADADNVRPSCILRDCSDLTAIGCRLELTCHLEIPNNIFMKAPATFSLRQSNADDATLFYDVINRTMRNFIITTWGAWNEERVRRESHEDSCSSNAQVIQIDDTAVGVLVVERCPTHIQLEQIYLLPEYQRMGIGRVLLERLIAEALQSKIPIRLRVMAVNPAKSFYEQHGFIITEATTEFFSMEKII
jgi:GNAT superfamily N-acetyltransferase